MLATSLYGVEHTLFTAYPSIDIRRKLFENHNWERTKDTDSGIVRAASRSEGKLGLGTTHLTGQRIRGTQGIEHSIS